MIDTNWGVYSDCVTVDEDEEESELGEERAKITLCALFDSTSPSTMRVIAIINGQRAISR